ncbi:MAG: M28 family peptidase [Verrucomicrobia bacterium]|nr:M28 family peptidase [Verrucomicrobiota bacterium]
MKAVLKRTEELGLGDAVTQQRIGWFTRQRNLIVEIPGTADEIVYIVAHYDKVDVNPFTLASNTLNGALDELVSLTYGSHGALDNATGVAVALELAATLLSDPNRRPTYRILLTGGEEAGLQGSRVHVAKLSAAEKKRIALVINIDCVGAAFKPNCVTAHITPDAFVQKALSTANRLGMELGVGWLPFGVSSDFAPFRKNSFARELGRGLMFNGLGGLLPKRSWFTSSHTGTVVNFSACDLASPSQLLSTAVLIPFGRIHGPRDRSNRINPRRLYEAYAIIRELLREKGTQGTEGHAWIEPHGPLGYRLPKRHAAQSDSSGMLRGLQSGRTAPPIFLAGPVD